MVKPLSAADNKAVERAIAEGERLTSAEIVVVIASASDSYQSYLSLYGLCVGSVIGLGLWKQNLVTAFPWLLMLQCGVISLLLFVPWLRGWGVRLVPRRVKHHRAARRAYEEYQIVARHVASATPIVLLYVSTAEHYVHILTSRMVREKLPDATWEGVIRDFTVNVTASGLREACTVAIKHITALAVPHFPERETAHNISNHVIELGH